MYVIAKAKEQQQRRSRLRRQVAGDFSERCNSGSAPVWAASGWLTKTSPCLEVDDRDPLVRHAGWLGPTKLVGTRRNIRQLTEVFVSCELFGDKVFDNDAHEQCESLLADLRGSVFWNRPLAEIHDWRAPDSEKLAGWLRDGGFQPAVDDENNLRMTLKARGCDGQVYLTRDHQSLRFTMRLGSWSNLADENERAMLHLARQANDRGRLARIAWIVDGKTRSCEAHVDLSGLPAEGPAERIWPGMLCMSMQGLSLTLRRLGMEMDALADPRNLAVASQMNASDLE